MERIAERDGLDAAGRARLSQDLRQTDPSLWPALMQAFEAALAYQRQMKERPKTASVGQISMSSEHRSAEAFPPSVERGPSNSSSGSRPPVTEPRTSVSQGEKASSPSPVDVGASALAMAPPQTLGESVPGPMTSGLRSLSPSAEREKELARGPIQSLGEKGEQPQNAAEEKNPSGVVLASYTGTMNAAGEPWLERLDVAVKALEAELRGSPQTSAEIAQQARLRLLYLAAGRREEALRPIPAASPAMQDSWAQMIYGLAAWMDVERMPDAGRRAAEARQQLLAAAQRLGELAPLLIRNASFAKEVKSYGDITPFEKTEFSPGQEVLLYAELENFKSEETPKGFHTQFRGSYEIFDARGQRVTAQELGKTEEYCRNHRRDFFVVYNFRLPRRIYNGRHTLQLTVEDLHGQKIGQSSLEFTVKGAAD